MNALNEWNTIMQSNKFISVAGVICEGSNESNITILYLNFNIFGKNKSYNMPIIYEFLASLPLEFDCQQLFSNDAVSGLYQKIDLNSIYFTNIEELHLYQGNKIIQTVCFEKINSKYLWKVICKKIQQHNRKYPDNILNLKGSIKLSWDGYPVLTCHSYLQIRLVEFWKSFRHNILIDSYETDEDPISLICGEVLTGGIMVGNIDESIDLP